MMDLAEGSGVMDNAPMGEGCQANEGGPKQGTAGVRSDSRGGMHQII